MHSLNRLHRDLKPANLLINHKGLVKISDFGIAKQLLETNHSAISTPSSADGATSSNLTTSRSTDSDYEASQGVMKKAHTFVGTAAYMSPERIDGREYSFPSDVWAFGLVMMALAKGHIPIETQSGYWAMLHAIRDMPSPSLDMAGDWSDGFRDFLSCCLNKDPYHRWTCSQLLHHRFLQSRILEEQSPNFPLLHGKDELLVVLHKIAEHINALKANSVEDASTLSLRSVMEKLIFNKRSGSLDESYSTHRLRELCDQLSLNESEAVACANEFLEAI